MIEETGTEDPIPLANIRGDILAKVVEYAKYHKEASEVRT